MRAHSSLTVLPVEVAQSLDDPLRPSDGESADVPVPIFKRKGGRAASAPPALIRVLQPGALYSATRPSTPTACSAVRARDEPRNVISCLAAGASAASLLSTANNGV